MYTSWPFDAEEAKWRQQETAEMLGVPVEYDEVIGRGVKLSLVLIPPGAFMMGCQEDERARPVHRVTLTKPFYIGKYPIDQAQWKAVTGHNPSRFDGHLRPVDNVSWDDCQGFLSKLNRMLSKTREEGLVLPTEAQWEFACRAGTSTRYHFGDDASQIGDHGWFIGNCGTERKVVQRYFLGLKKREITEIVDRRPHSVGQKKPNVWGLHDLHGNVWEWTQTIFAKYSSADVTDPIGPSSGELHICRGGSWANEAPNLISASRHWYAQGYAFQYLGFRIARLVPFGPHA